jgi:hypothetical protein
MWYTTYNCYLLDLLDRLFDLHTKYLIYYLCSERLNGPSIGVLGGTKDVCVYYLVSTRNH